MGGQMGAKKRHSLSRRFSSFFFPLYVGLHSMEPGIPLLHTWALKALRRRVFKRTHLEGPSCCWEEKSIALFARASASALHFLGIYTTPQVKNLFRSICTLYRRSWTLLWQIAHFPITCFTQITKDQNKKKTPHLIKQRRHVVKKPVLCGYQKWHQFFDENHKFFEFSNNQNRRFFNSGYLFPLKNWH